MKRYFILILVSSGFTGVSSNTGTSNPTGSLLTDSFSNGTVSTTYIIAE